MRGVAHKQDATGNSIYPSEVGLESNKESFIYPSDEDANGLFRMAQARNRVDYETPQTESTSNNNENNNTNNESSSTE